MMTNDGFFLSHPVINNGFFFFLTMKFRFFSLEIPELANMSVIKDVVTYNTACVPNLPDSMGKITWVR